MPEHQAKQVMSSSDDPEPPTVPHHPERIIDVNQWARKEVFEMYKNGANPSWGITVRINVTVLRKLCKEKKLSYLRASLFIYGLTCNQYEPMRYRIRKTTGATSISDKNDDSQQEAQVVICHEKVHPSMTILRSNDKYGFVAFDGSTESFTEFCAHADKAMHHFHNHTTGLAKSKDSFRDDLTFGSALPWIDFSNYEHAETGHPTHSVPKYVFGKLVHDERADTWSQAFCLHVHHGLMDGLHVGRFLEKFQQNLDNAAALLDT